MSFDPMKYDLAFADPTYLTDSSAWVGHIPFAWALLQMARPRTLVELGTLRGDSYCAFCQGVDLLKLDTKCTAIDTWAGDVHTGPYSQAVLQNLRAYHDPRYGRFSRLLQSDFDSAVSRFPDRSIDVLHIDGLHTYEAVRHDFETWRPKVSDRGVILFHDTAVRDAGFGVWKLWGEVSKDHPSFEFHHESGLGVLGLGADLPAGMREFFTASRDAPDQVRLFFSILGQRIIMGKFNLIYSLALDEQRKLLNDWLVSRGQPPYAGEMPSASPMNAVATLMRDFRQAISCKE